METLLKEHVLNKQLMELFSQNGSKLKINGAGG
jgi:hypothetical protein